MAAKPKPIITMGKYRGQQVTITRKKAKPNFVMVKVAGGTEVQIHKQFIK